MKERCDALDVGEHHTFIAFGYRALTGAAEDPLRYRALTGAAEDPSASPRPGGRG